MPTGCFLCGSVRAKYLSRPSHYESKEMFEHHDFRMSYILFSPKCILRIFSRQADYYFYA